MIYDIVELAGLLVIISLSLPAWWFSSACFFLCSSKVSFPDLYHCLARTWRSSGLCWFVASCGLLRLAFAICIVVELAPGGFGRVVASCALRIVVGLQDRCLALLSLLGYLWSSEVSISDLYHCSACTWRSSDLCQVVAFYGLLRLAIAICIVVQLAPGDFYLVVTSCGLFVIVGLQGCWLVLLSLLGCL